MAGARRDLLAEMLSVRKAFDLAAIKLLEPSKVTPLPFSTEACGAAEHRHHHRGLSASRDSRRAARRRGIVSSLKGPRGDEVGSRIPAPVQPGKSGGRAIEHHRHGRRPS
ncbi:hypothetical protein GCM10011324_28000 [Allosediminivita pacifica]|nr:hypothetical protein GCM10011324_28000 [Allosediminivita pacifica]